jgi:glycosyltransferase involved in cell wall biosynthesis
MVVFTARRLIRRVGIAELLEAAAMLKAKHLPLLIKIAGGGPLAGDIRDSITRLGLGDIVELLGFVSNEDLVRCYQAADMTVMPSQALEGFGMTIGESLACGTPVLVTPIGGMPEVVAPLDANLIARSASSSDIAEILGRACVGDLILPTAEICRKHVVENGSWALVCRQLREVFAHAAADRAAAEHRGAR